jgi:hypothetical protein
MKKELCVLIILFLIPFVLSEGESIILDYPLGVDVGEEFEIDVNLIDFQEDLYDIKFEIKNDSENIAEKFWEDEWKSTYYWTNDFINTSKVDNKLIKIRISENYNGKTNFSVKLRDSSGDIFEFENYSIDINPEEIVVKPKVSYELDWNEDSIQNGDDFKIKVKIFDLEDKKYDVKIWIQDDENIISERYDYEDEEWRSGKYYLSDFFEGPGNKSEKVKLRIKSEYSEYIGEADLFFKTRDEDQIEYEIDVLEEEEEEEKIDEIEEIKLNNEVEYKEKEEIEIITLGDKGNEVDNKTSENLKTGNDTIYKSDNEIMKEYSMYVFVLFIVILCILIIWRKI